MGLNLIILLDYLIVFEIKLKNDLKYNYKSGNYSFDYKMYYLFLL